MSDFVRTRRWLRTRIPYKISVPGATNDQDNTTDIPTHPDSEAIVQKFDTSNSAMNHQIDENMEESEADQDSPAVEPKPASKDVIQDNPSP